MEAVSTAVHSHHHARTNTGLLNGLLGVMCFLVSEMGLFGTLIFMALYERRASHPIPGVCDSAWPTCIPHSHKVYEFFGSDLALPTINTVVLLSSGVTMHFAYQALRRGNMSRMLGLLILTIVLGVGFLSGQAWEYKHVVDVSLTTNIYGATFFTLTGLHGLHVTGGVCFLLFILYGTLRGKYHQRETMVPHAATLYWHFVDAVWVVLFALFYLTVQP
jgi:cytochrome c oxidase subunit 3